MTEEPGAGQTAQTAMTVAGDGDFLRAGILRRCEVHTRYLIPPEDLTFEDWGVLLTDLNRVADASVWWLGDALVYGEAHFPETYSQISDLTGYSPSRISLAIKVSETFPPESRIWDLSYTHYSEVAYNTPVDAMALLTLAQEYGWSAHDLRARARDAKIESNLPERATEEKKQIHFAYANWTPVAFRLKQYRDANPVIADRVDRFITEMESLLQQGMKQGVLGAMADSTTD